MTKVDRTIRRRSIIVAGRKTTITLEEPFYQAIKDIAAERNRHPSQLYEEIDRSRGSLNLSSAIRVFVIEHYSALDRSIAPTSENSVGLSDPSKCSNMYSTR